MKERIMARRVFGLPGHVARAVMTMVSLAAGLGVVSGAPAAMEPSSAAPAVEDVACFRPLTAVIWGFLVTLLACTVALWGIFKHKAQGKSAKIRLVFLAVFAPICGLIAYILASIQNAVLMWKYLKSSQPLSRHSQFKKFCVEDESEAMVIGEVAEGKTKDDDYERMELSNAGKIALILAEVVPTYDELKFLRGNSGFAVIAIAIQALGYIYAVVFRTVKDLPVAPLEVIGLILNIVC